jgi:hypothetical protein
MTILRMDNVGVVVHNLAAAIAFFVELGLELEGKAKVEGRWADRVVGLDGVRVDVAMMRTPDGHGRLELMKFLRPTAATFEPKNAPANTLGLRRIMFAVEGIDGGSLRTFPTSVACHVCGGSAIPARCDGPSDRTAELRGSSSVGRSTGNGRGAWRSGFSVLLTHRIVTVLLTPIPDSLQASSEPLGNSLHVHCELPLSAAGAYVHKAQEIEVAGFFSLLPCLLVCISPEFNQPRFLRVQCQAVLLKPFGKTASTLSAFSLYWKHKMASSANRISYASPFNRGFTSSSDHLSRM